MKENQSQKGALHQCSGTGEDVAGQHTELKKPVFRAQLTQRGTSCGVGCQQISRRQVPAHRASTVPPCTRDVHHGKTRPVT